ncbi:nucleotide exchange factor GrpE [Pleurocapsales cyanobacterium LEGE 06147]|nr:nucleotide exchange factor GrpE [Pleurocapsales cyanobacterium LEGE 06147]
MIDEQKQPENTLETQESTSAQHETNQETTERESSAAANWASQPESSATPQTENWESTPTDFAEVETIAETANDLLKENEEIIAALQQENANLKQLLDRQGDQINTLKAQYARLAADFDNFRKRTLKEKENLEQQAKISVITELLPVVDNFERARTQIKPASEGEKTIQNSYQGVYKTLVDCLKRLGVSAMRPEGQQFDPNLHEAMLRESTDEYPEGTVIEQLMRGYVLGDKVLRHAMVKVAVPKEPMITSEEENIAEDNQLENTDS